MSAQTYDHAMSQTFVRRVVTGIDADGRHVITDDGAAPNTIVTDTVAVSEVLWLDGPQPSIADDPDKANSGFALEPPPGGASARIIQMPGIPAGADPDTTWLRVAGDSESTPGLHATDTLDLMVVLEGSVVMGLEDGERTIGPGEFVIQRGTLHRWRPADEHGWTYFVAMLRPDVQVSAEPVNVKPATAGDKPIRRVVTGSPVVDGGSADRRVVTGPPVVDGGAADAMSSPTTTITDLWHTGGPLQTLMPTTWVLAIPTTAMVWAMPPCSKQCSPRRPPRKVGMPHRRSMSMSCYVDAYCSNCPMGSRPNLDPAMLSSSAERIIAGPQSAMNNLQWQR